MNKYAQHYFNSYVNKMAENNPEKANGITYGEFATPGEGERETFEPDPSALTANREKAVSALPVAESPAAAASPASSLMSQGNQSYGRNPLTGSFNSPSAQANFSQAMAPKFTLENNQGSTPASLNIGTGIDPARPAMGLTQGSSSLAPSLQDRWSKYHGEEKANAYNPNSKRDVAMLKAMEAAQSGGEKAIRAIADGPLSRPAMKQPRR